jgi:hypothetical protein
MVVQHEIGCSGKGCSCRAQAHYLAISGQALPRAGRPQFAVSFTYISKGGECSTPVQKVNNQTELTEAIRPHLNFGNARGCSLLIHVAQLED